MSNQRFYRLLDDMLVPQRWVLGEPQGGTDWIDPSQFIAGTPASIEIPLTFEVLKPGRPLELSFGHPGVPVVSQRAADLLVSVSGSQVQLIPVSVEGHPGPFFIANATRLADCVDEQTSRGVRTWKVEDDQPAKVGEYQGFETLRIDPMPATGLDFFRVARYTVALIVSDRLKRAMEEAKLLGPKFDLVTPP
jgi:uncharacterized protein DUF1629